MGNLDSRRVGWLHLPTVARCLETAWARCALPTLRELRLPNPESRIPALAFCPLSSVLRHLNHTDLVATTGGTREARSAGASTANCPSANSSTAPSGRYVHGNRCNS